MENVQLLVSDDAATVGYVEELLEICKLRQVLVVKWYSVRGDH